MSWNFLQGNAGPKGGLFGFLRGVGEATAHPFYQLGNEGVALGQAVTGNLKGAKKTLSPGGGLGHQGGVFGGEEVSNKAIFAKPKNIVKAVGTGANIASTVAPFGAVKAATLGSRIAKNAAASGGLGFLGSTGSQLADTGTINPTQTLKDTALGAAVGGAIPIAGAAGRKSVKAAQEVRAAAEAQASKVSGLDSTKIINSNEAGTLRDFADYKTGAYRPPVPVINQLELQARHAASTAGIDVTSGSSQDVTDRIYNYLSQRTQHLHTRGTLLQGGYIGLPGGEDLNKVTKSDNIPEIKKTLEGKIPQRQINDVAPALAMTKDKHIASKLAEPKISELGGAKPNNDIQTQIEQAHNSGDTATAARLISQLPPADHETMKSALGVGAPTETATQRVISALNSNGPPNQDITYLQQRQKQLYSTERKTRLAKASSAGANLGGREALHSQLSALKGELPKVNSDALVEHLKTKITPDDINGILDDLRKSPKLSGYEPITAQHAVIKLFDEGKVPTPSEVKILNKALGTDFADSIGNAVNESQTKLQKLKNVATQLLGAPKSILASLDLSAPLRQGGVLGSRFGKEFAQASKESLKYFGSKKNYEAALEDINNRDTAALMKKAGLAIAGPEGIHEETYASTIAEKIPGIGKGIQASDRAYTGFLSKLRADSFDHIMHDLDKAGVNIDGLADKQLKSIGRYINTASGRGNLGIFEKHAQSLGEALFSPRLWKSRLDMLNPVYYAKLDPIARKYALQSAASFAAIASTVLGLASLAGAKVVTDARSSDFGKIKVGDTRYDILGGFQQNIVLLWREISGEKKSSITGGITKLGSGFNAPDRLSILSDFVQNKENPTIGAAQTIIRGKDKAGNPANPLTEIAKLAIPLGIQDTASAIKNRSNVAEGVGLNLPGVFGVGVGTYGLKDVQLTDRQQAYIQKLTDQGADKPQLEATTRFYQTLKSGPDRVAASEAINQALAKNDFEGAIQAAKDYNQKYAASFKDWAKKYGKYGDDQQLLKDYQARKIKLTGGTVKQRLQTIKDNPSKYGG